VTPQSNAIPPKRRISPAAITITAILFILVPFLTWEQTWFGRELSDGQIDSYLADAQHPRKIQHALSQISDRIMHGDPATKKWIPQVAALADNPAVPVRSTAAWVMGQDNSSPVFHQQLLKLLNDPDPIVRRNAALSLVRFQDSSGRPELLSILHAYTVQAPVSGRVKTGVLPRQPIGTGTVLARIAPSSGSPVEVHAAFAGEVVSLIANNGDWVNRGEGLVRVDSGSDQAWEALRGLYLIGQAEDVAEVENYTHHALGISDSLKQQAEVTAAAIRARSSRIPSR
jgi:hypothetical protein